jgi:hypothetical protein
VANAEIEIRAVDRGIEIVGLKRGEALVLEEGEGIKLPARPPAHRRRRRRPKIGPPRPLPPGGPVRARLLPSGELAPAPERHIASLERGEPIVFSLSFSQAGAEKLDMRQLRTVAAQAANLDRPLVIATIDPPDD